MQGRSNCVTEFGQIKVLINRLIDSFTLQLIRISLLNQNFCQSGCNWCKDKIAPINLQKVCERFIIECVSMYIFIPFLFSKTPLQNYQSKWSMKKQRLNLLRSDKIKILHQSIKICLKELFKRHLSTYKQFWDKKSIKGPQRTLWFEKSEILKTCNQLHFQ